MLRAMVHFLSVFAIKKRDKEPNQTNTPDSTERRQDLCCACYSLFLVTEVTSGAENELTLLFPGPLEDIFRQFYKVSQSMFQYNARCLFPVQNHNHQHFENMRKMSFQC